VQFPIQNRAEQSGRGALETAEHRESFTALRTCRSCVTASTSPSDFALARVDGLAGQHQRHRLHRVDELREAHGAAEARMQPSITSGKPNRASSDCNPHLAGKGYFKAAAETKAVDHGDRGHAQASSRSITACARPIAVSTAPESVTPRNSLTSAPAMKPEVPWRNG